MREPARYHHRVDVAERVVGVPEHLGVAAELLDRPGDVELAVGAGKQDDAHPHAHARTLMLATAP